MAILPDSSRMPYGQKGVLKKSASGVLAPLSCSRTHLYAPLAKPAAALLNELFEPFLIVLDWSVIKWSGVKLVKILNYSTVSKGLFDLLEYPLNRTYAGHLPFRHFSTILQEMARGRPEGIPGCTLFLYLLRIARLKRLSGNCLPYSQ